MNKLKQLPEEIINNNFFGMSYAGQIKIIEQYKIILGEPGEYKSFNNFKKYISIIKKFIEFKSNFNKFNDEDRQNLRKIISRIKENKTNTKQYEVTMINQETINDDYVEKYINDFFSYDKSTKQDIAYKLENSYSTIGNLSFEQTLNLCESNKDFVNHEIRILSKDFYSLYITMNTTERMKYIWYLSHYNPFIKDENKTEIKNDYQDIFENEIINPFPISYTKKIENKSKFSKYFKMNN